MIKKIKKFIFDSDYRFSVLASIGMLKNVSDEIYIKRIYEIYMGKKLDLKIPLTFNEKIQWLKLNDRNDLYTLLVDKYEAKFWVEKVIGKQYIIPTLRVYNNIKEIDFSELPKKFVLKCTHDSGGLCVCRDKNTIEEKKVLKKLKKSLNRNFYYLFREWAYKNVQPRIICEKYIENDDKTPLQDYKFFCFNGEPKFLYISKGMENHSSARISFFDLNGGILPFHRSDYRSYNENIRLPNNFNEMENIARKLAKAIKCCFVRIDLYSVNNKTYFSEITFYPNGGLIPFDPPEYDLKIGNLLKLSES